MRRRVSRWLLIALCLLLGLPLASARAEDFVPTRDGVALDQPSGPTTIGPLKAGASYPLLKRGGPSTAWCKLRLPEGQGWVRCSAGSVRGAGAPDGKAPPEPPPRQRDPRQQQAPQQQAPQQQGPRQQPPPGGPPFDYYLLSLSWSPTFCAQGADRSPEQCGLDKHFGFVVHGLWPQSEAGMGPMSCPSEATLADEDVAAMLDLMPSRRLVRHEWEKHGTCSGLSPKEYFARARAARGAIRVPAALRQPAQAVSASLEEIEAMFIAENPGLSADMIAVQCRGQVSEVRFCLDKDLRPRRCGGRVRDVCTGRAVFPPLR